MNVVASFSAPRSRAAGVLAIVAVTVLSTACSGLFEGPNVQYKTEQSKQQPLEVPPDLAQLPRDDRYIVPGTNKGSVSASSVNNSTTAGSASTPTAATVLPVVQGVTLQRDGSQRWLDVQMAPEKAWPIIHQFWIDQGFLFTTDDQASGVLETDWAENRGKLPQGWLRRAVGSVLSGLSDSGLRDRYRTRLTRTANGTEITITHRGVEETLNASKDTAAWVPRASDPELEAEFLQRLMVRLGTPEDKARTDAVASTTAVKASGAARATIVTTPQGRQIDLDETLDRAWRRTGLALDRIGFTVENRDRSNGYYVIRFVDPDRAEQEQGFFSKLFNLTPDNVAQQMRVVVKQEGAMVRVSVTAGDTAAGAKAPSPKQVSEVSDRIIGLVYDELK
ncbi:outer membrane protein assembly factor BamC [soil metagenome]